MYSLEVNQFRNCKQIVVCNKYGDIDYVHIYCGNPKFTCTANSSRYIAMLLGVKHMTFGYALKSEHANHFTTLFVVNHLTYDYICALL